MFDNNQCLGPSFTDECSINVIVTKVSKNGPNFITNEHSKNQKRVSK